MHVTRLCVVLCGAIMLAAPAIVGGTAGVYKFRSTMSGQLPTDDDLFRTITLGIAGTSMDHYAVLPERDRRALVA